MVSIYVGIIIIAVILTDALRPHHQSDNPAPTQEEVDAYREQDSINFRAIRRVEQGQSDYTIPDSAIKVGVH